MTLLKITEKAALPSLRDLVRMAIETESYTSNEKGILDKLQSLVVDLESAPKIYRGHFGLVIIWEGEEGKDAPLYLFDGHVDTVTVGEAEKYQWLTDPFEAVFKYEEGEEFVYGKGAVDQQGGYLSVFKALVETMEQCKDGVRENSVGIALVRAEEVAEGFASENIYQELIDEGYENIEGVVITEPSDAVIMTGQMGRLRLKIVDHDKNPAALAALISRLYSFERVAKVTGEKQALTLIGANLLSDYDGAIDSQVPDRAVLRLRGGEVMEDRLDDLKREGSVIDYNYVVEDGVSNIDLTGKTAHSAFPWKGINAGVVLAELVRDLDGEILLAQTGGKEGGAIDAGVLYYDYRIDVGETPDSFIAELRSFCAKELDQMPNIEMSVSTQRIELDGVSHDVYQYFPAWELTRESRFLAVLKAAACEEFALEEVPVGAWGFCTNGSGWAKKEGVELIGIGPGDPTLAHQPNERCPVEEMERVCRLLQSFVCSLMSGDFTEG